MLQYKYIFNIQIQCKVNFLSTTNVLMHCVKEALYPRKCIFVLSKVLEFLPHVSIGQMP